MRMLIAVVGAMLVSVTVRADPVLLGMRNAELTMLRVHDVGTGFGPSSDFIDVEVVIEVAGTDGGFGFQLRDDLNRFARQGMLDLLRDAMRSDDLLVNFDYWIDPDIHKNGVIIRVWLTKALPGNGRGPR